MKKKKPLIKSRQKIIEQKNAKRKAKRQLIQAKNRAKISFSPSSRPLFIFGKNLLDKMREIEDYRKKSDYHLAELLTAG